MYRRYDSVSQKLVHTKIALRNRLRVFRVPAGKPEAGFAAVNAPNRYESGEAPDIFYVTLNVEARKNGDIVMHARADVNTYVTLVLNTFAARVRTS